MKQQKENKCNTNNLKNLEIRKCKFLDNPDDYKKQNKKTPTHPQNNKKYLPHKKRQTNIHSHFTCHLSYTVPMNINEYVPILINTLDTIVRRWG